MGWAWHTLLIIQSEKRLPNAQLFPPSWVPKPDSAELNWDIDMGIVITVRTFWLRVQLASLSLYWKSSECEKDDLSLEKQDSVFLTHGRAQNLGHGLGLASATAEPCDLEQATEPHGVSMLTSVKWDHISVSWVLVRTHWVMYGKHLVPCQTHSKHPTNMIWRSVLTHPKLKRCFQGDVIYYFLEWLFRSIHKQLFIGRTDAKAEAPILWLPDAKSWLAGKDPDAGKEWGQEKGAA